jgi:hypothetical protein
MTTTKPAVAQARDKITAAFKLRNFRIEWFDFTALMKPATKGLMVRLEITGISQNVYDRINVRFINKVNGLVDEKTFEFSDYLVSRDDKRPDYEGRIYIWQKGDSIDWYIAQPADLEEIMLPIEKYILAWDYA